MQPKVVFIPLLAVLVTVVTAGPLPLPLAMAKADTECEGKVCGCLRGRRVRMLGEEEL